MKIQLKMRKCRVLIFCGAALLLIFAGWLFSSASGITFARSINHRIDDELIRLVLGSKNLDLKSVVAHQLASQCETDAEFAQQLFDQVFARASKDDLDRIEPSGFYAMGKLHMVTHRYDDAMKDFKRALELWDNGQTYNWSLHRIELELAYMRAEKMVEVNDIMSKRGWKSSKPVVETVATNATTHENR